MTTGKFKAKVERSSFGTEGARAARRSVTAAKSRSVVERARAIEKNHGKGGRSAGG